MIKRDGVQLMNERTGNVSIAKETIEICKNKQYVSPSGKTIDISKELDSAIAGTVYYKAEDNLPDMDWGVGPSIVEVTNETTAQAATRLVSLGKTNILALNFASARNQGGGFLGGALAQEEDLCRASGLYSCLKKKPLFYNANILCDDHYYTDGIIYSPNVPFFRDTDNKFLEDPFTLSIVSAPAPNLNSTGKMDGERIVKTLSNRVLKILQVAATHGHKNLILGAWGCGAFGNDSAMVATVFNAGIMMTPAFEHVCFAVYDTKPGQPTYEIFKKAYQ